MSAVTADSVSGMPRSAARLSAMCSSRRIRPGDRVLGHRRVGELAQLLQRGLRVLERAAGPAASRCSGASSPRISSARSTRAAGGDRGPGRAAQVGVVEVGQPVGGGPHLAAHPPLLPGQHATRARPCRVSSAPIASPSRTTTRSAPRTSRALAVTPSRRAAPTSASAASGPGQVISSGGAAARLGERAVGEERAAPRGLGVADAAGDDGRRQAAHRTAARRRAGRSGGPAPRRRLTTRTT